MLKIGENVLVRAEVVEEIRTKDGVYYRVKNPKAEFGIIVPESELQIDEETNEFEAQSIEHDEIPEVQNDR